MPETKFDKQIGQPRELKQLTFDFYGSCNNPKETQHLLPFMLDPERWIEGRPALATRPEIIKLENGAHIQFLPDPSSPIAKIHIQVNAGSWQDKPTGSGLAHLIEHAIFENVSANPQIGYVDRWFRENTLQKNGGTWFTDTTFTADCDPSKSSEVFTNYCAAIFKSNWNFNLTGEKRTIWAESKGRTDNKPSLSKLADDELIQTAWSISPENFVVIGDTRARQRIKMSDILAFHEQYYIPENVRVIVSGRMTEADLQKITSELAALPTRPQTPTQPTLNKVNIEPGHHVIRNYDIERTDFARGYIMPGGDTQLSEIANWVLSIHLNEQVRLKTHGVYDVSCYSPLRTSDHTLHRVFFLAHPKDFKDCQKLVDQLIKGVIKDGLPEQLFKNSKQYKLEALQQMRASDYCTQKLRYTQELADKEQAVKRLQKITWSELNAYLKAMLTSASTITRTTRNLPGPIFRLTNLPFGKQIVDTAFSILEYFKRS